jgi:RNA polymerase sigma-70 factor (ECF subfamily)
LTSVLHDAIKVVTRRDRERSLEETPSIDASIADGRCQPEAIWQQAETADEVWTALGTLTPDQRAAVVAHYYLDLSHAEMTRALGCPPSTIKWRLHSARARLRLLLTPLISYD